jgi:hypothetical protein
MPASHLISANVHGYKVVQSDFLKIKQKVTEKIALFLHYLLLLA